MALSKVLTRFRHLSGAERAIALQALVLLPTIHVLLRLIGFRRAIALMQRFNLRQSNSPTNESNVWAWSIAQLVRSAARRGVVHGNCLSQSLTLWWLLRRHGIAS